VWWESHRRGEAATAVRLAEGLAAAEHKPPTVLGVKSQMLASEQAAGASPWAAERPADLRPRDASTSVIHFHGLAFAATTQGNGPTAARG